jgi:iron complex outermembrane recepter protein
MTTLPIRCPRLHAIATACALCCAVAAAAQTAPSTQADDRTAEKQEKAAPQTIVVTGNRRAQTASKVPYNINALSADALRESNITDVKKLISESVGINAPENSARFADSVTVQGLNVAPVNANNLEFFVRSTLAYYLDDTPLPNIGFRIKDVSRVETLLGPQGTLYGAGALGGTIRYITNQPKLGRMEAKLNTSLYQVKYGGLSTDVDGAFNVPLGERFAFRAALSKLDEKGYTDRISNPPWRTGASAWTTQPDPNRNLYEDDDWQKVDGGRLSLLWQISRDVKLTLAQAEQKQFANGTTATSLLPLGVANARTPAERDAAWQDPNLDEGNSSTAGLPCATPAPGNCPYDDRFFTPFTVNDHTVVSRWPEFANRRFQLRSIDLDWDLGFANLHSSTSEFRDSRRGQADYASQGWNFYSPESPILAGFDLGGSITSDRSAYLTFDNSYKGVSHETRLTSKGSGPLTWLAGLYHTTQKRGFNFSEVLPGLTEYITGIGTGPANPDGRVDEGYREIIASQYKETALFGDIGYRITPQWQVSGGARLFNYDDKVRAQLIDYAGGIVDTERNESNGESGKSYFRLNTSFDLSPDLLAYATFSQGFRRGGTNPFTNRGTRIVREEQKRYEPDTTNNLEAGLKGYLFNKALYLETSVFRIDWKDVQTFFSQDVNGFPVNGTTNGPDARSTGLNLRARYNLLPDLQLSYEGTTAQAKWVSTETVCLYEATDSDGAAVTVDRQGCRTWEAGGKLGGGPKWKHMLGLRYATTVAGDIDLTARLTARYVGAVRTDRADSEAGNAGVRIFPAFTRYNASVSVARAPWDVQLWVQNLTNERALVSSQAGGIMGERVIYTQPRTVGLNVSYEFK